MRRLGIACSAGRLFSLFLVPCVVASAADWPQFRGPNASGVSKTATPPVEFAPGTNQLWKVAVPPGSSSPCIWKDRVFLTAFEDGKLWTLCLDREKGALLWKRDANANEIEEFHPTEGSPAASTVRFAASSSPIRRIACGVGPTNARPCCSQRAANVAFSARNP